MLPAFGVHLKTQWLWSEGSTTLVLGSGILGPLSPTTRDFDKSLPLHSSATYPVHCPNAADFSYAPTGQLPLWVRALIAGHAMHEAAASRPLSVCSS